MTDKQIEEKLQEVETNNPVRFKQYKLRAHLHWKLVEGTDKLTWGFHHSFLGNLPANVKVEVSKLMGKLTKGGYTPGAEEVEKPAKKKREKKVEKAEETE